MSTLKMTKNVNGKIVELSSEEIETILNERQVEEDKSKIVTSDMVNVERDKRISSGIPFRIGEKIYFFDFDQMGKDNITGAASLAKFALFAGAKAGDFRWANPDVDFTWITQNNSKVSLDAPTMSKLGDVAAGWTTKHIYAARALKDMSPIPQDYAADEYWP